MFGLEMIPMAGQKRQVYDEYSVNSTWTCALFDFVFFTQDTVIAISSRNFLYNYNS